MNDSLKIVGIYDQHQQKEADQYKQDPDENKQYIKIDGFLYFLHVCLLYIVIPEKTGDS